jgi:predicted SAM-dependent methyltransferase
MVTRLNLGCGIKHEKGYINIDLDRRSGAEIVASVVSLPFFSDGSVDAIVAYHLIEHLSRAEFDQAIAEWYRILKHKGTIVLECPDFEELCKEFLRTDKVNRWYSYQETWHPLIAHFYGKQTSNLQLHKNGFTKDRLEDLLGKNGYVQIKFLKPEYKYCPSIRVKAVKP